MTRRTANRRSSPGEEAHGRPSLSAVDELLTQVAHGSKVAFAALYDEVSGPVYGTVLGIVADVDLAREITREALVQVWQTAPQFSQATGSGMSWSLAIARRLAFGHQSTTAEPDLTAQGEQPTSLLPQNPYISLDWLPVMERQALSFAIYEGIKLGQIADHLAISPGEAATLLRDGLLRVGRRQGSATGDVRR